MLKRYLILFQVHREDFKVGLLSVCNRENLSLEPIPRHLQLGLVILVLVYYNGKARVEVVGANIDQFINEVLYVIGPSISCHLVDYEDEAIGVASVVRP